MNTNKIENIIESAKEALRVVIIAVLPVVLVGINTTTGEININWRIVLAIGLVALLKSIDKFLHLDSTVNGWLEKQGLTGF